MRVHTSGGMEVRGDTWYWKTWKEEDEYGTIISTGIKHYDVSHYRGGYYE